METQSRIWNLLVKKDRGTASKAELLELAQLLAGQPDIQKMIEDLDSYWSSVAGAPESEQMKAMSDSNRLLAQTKLDLSGHRHTYNNRRTLKKLIAVVAIILTIIGTVTFVYLVVAHSTHNINIVRTKNGSKTEITLPDGSRVSMNGGSELSYPDNFKNSSTREVTICGEAYFDVKHDSSHPFIIHTQYLDIRDIGTVFNVRAYPNETSEATLISGSIEVNIRDKPETVLRLKPREKVIFAADTPASSASKPKSHPLSQGTLKVMKVAPIVGSSGDTIVPETAWTKNQLVFRSEAFGSLAGRMERWFNVKFYFINNDVRQYVFTGIFEAETLEESLRELQLSRPFNFTVTKDSVIITGNQPGSENDIQ